LSTATRIRHATFAGVATLACLSPAGDGRAAAPCPSVSDAPLKPKDAALCASLEQAVRRPSAQLDRYETLLARYLGNLCHRNPGAGWKVDKRMRDTGPYVATYRDGRWSGEYYGTHPAVLVWYSPEMYDWLKANRPAKKEDEPRAAQPVPDGAMMVKEMYSPPATVCTDVEWERLRPTKGITLMIRDRKASHDGWFWGWLDWKKAADWSDWSHWPADWPAAAKNPLPDMGYGQYCTNCHASAKDNQTFASLQNIAGEPGEPLVYLSQDFHLDAAWLDHHAAVAQAGESSATPPATGAYDPAFLATYGAAAKALGAELLTRDKIAKMPSQTYDNVWMPAAGPSPSSQFLTSDQCIGCHDAHGAALRYDMTEPGPDGKLINISPYATWRTSPMGLSGRDPIFYAQLASETDTFHRGSSAVLQDACLSCHGIGGQRQFAIDRFAASKCDDKFLRADVDAVPFPKNDPAAAYGALARDGVTCNACHQMALDKTARAAHAREPQNACVAERQAYLTPDLDGFARTFSGSFFMGAPDVLYGPFPDPKQKSMKNAIGISPEHNRHIRSSEVCGSCHMVHLPILHRDKAVGYVFEQATYAEWAFSDYRTGTTPDGELPGGPGAQAQSCQDCHMPSRGADGHPYRSKIAAIQEYSTFPQAEYTLPRQDIDLPRRTGFAQHTLVGLNLFLTKMAQQFPDLLGIRAQDPMLVGAGLDPAWFTERAILEQAGRRTAVVTIGEVKTDGGTLSATVTVVNKTGHKFPTGVGFRRAFLEFRVLDAKDVVLWSSGRTNKAGVIVDEAGAPIAGELWWTDDCSQRLNPQARVHQPHYEVIDRQAQAQIYEELVSAPAEVDTPACGTGVAPAGMLTTSFLSQCTKAKDNRILPHGFLPLAARTAIANSLGAGHELAEDVAARGVGEDPDYRSGGADALVYRVPLAALSGKAAAIEATLYYQATPPYFLQDRFCTSKSDDTRRLYFTAGNLDLKDTAAKDWKLKVFTAGPIALP
jgi:cytochrome c553